MNLYNNAVAERAAIKAWVENALSETVKQYRLETLGKAFGLQLHYLQAYIDEQTVMGPGLRAEVIAWCNDNPEVGPNQPSDDIHWLADLGDLG